MKIKSLCVCNIFASKTQIDETVISWVRLPVGLYPWHSWDSNTTKDVIVHFDLAQDCMRLRGEGTFLALSETILCKQETSGRNLWAKPLQFSYCHFGKQIFSSWNITILVIRGHHSSVGIAIFYGVDCLVFETSWEWDFPQTSIPAQRHTQLPSTRTMDTGVLCRG
jgi:hypothetical protein